MITAGALATNMRNWDFSKGKISFDKNESDIIREGLEKETPAVLTREEIAVCGSKVFKYYCPKCGNMVWRRFGTESMLMEINYCAYCGNRVIRPKEEANGDTQKNKNNQ